MGFSKEEKSKRILRGVKTLFFLITMLISLLLFSAPILLIIADTLLPSALLSASLSPTSLSPNPFFPFYQLRFSLLLIDIPLISIIRSAVILCVYSLCDGPKLSRGPYLAIATICSVSSLVFVSLKASYVFSNLSYNYGEGYVRAMEIALFLCSWILAIGHIVVAYRTSCRERRKLLVYKIDIEAVSFFLFLSHTVTRTMMINLGFINQFGRFENISGMIKSKLVFGGGEEPFLILAYWVGKLDLQVCGSHVCINMTKNHFHSLHKWLTIGLGGIESYSSRWPWPLRCPKIRVSLFKTGKYSLIILTENHSLH